jgi:hypothetical protein
VTTTLAGATAWWFPAVPVARIAWLRTFVGAFVWLDVLWLRPWIAERGDVPGVLYQELTIGRLLRLPTPTPVMADVLLATLLVSALLVAVGRLPRLAGTVLALAYLQWLVMAFSYGKVDHDAFAFLVALGALATVGAAGHRDLTPSDRAGWAVRVVQVAVVATYFLSVLAKARYGGGLVNWAESATFMRAVVRRGTFLADPLLAHAWLLTLGQYALVTIELASPLLLVPGRVGRWMLGLFFSFHAVTYASLTIGFFPHLVAMTAFLPLEALGRLLAPDWWRSRLRRRQFRPAG